MKKTGGAVRTTYDFAFNIQLSDDLGIFARDFVTGIKMSVEPARPGPTVGFNIGEVFKHWAPRNWGGDGVARRIDRFTTLARMFWASRSYDLESLPGGHWIFQPDGTDFETCEKFRFKYYMTKQRKCEEDQKRLGWTDWITVTPISAERIKEVPPLGDMAGAQQQVYATRLAENCCPVRALGRLWKYLDDIKAPKVKLRKGGVLLQRLSVIPWKNTGLAKIPAGEDARYAKSKTISKYVKDFHNKYMTTSCGGGNDFEPRHWRHVSASCMKAVACGDEVKLRCQHKSERTYEDYYCVQPPSEFTKAWGALPASKLGLSVEERMLVAGIFAAAPGDSI